MVFSRLKRNINYLIMSNVEFFSSTSPEIQPNTRANTLNCLIPAGRTCKEAWVLGRAAPDSVLEVRLIGQRNEPLSDVSQLYGANDVSRTRMLNVNIPAGSFPPVVRLEARNTSDKSTAWVEGVQLLFS